MDYIAQFWCNEPSSVAFFQPATKQDYCTAISKIYTRALHQRHISKRGQIV